MSSDSKGEDRRRRPRPRRHRRRSEAGRARARDRQRPSGRSDRRRQSDPELIWARPEPGESRAGHTRAEIAAAAIRIADAEGFEAVSMRRVAAELGAGTMTLYHYLHGKDELIALVNDALMGELLVAEGEMPGHWRDALTEIAQRTRATFVRHPWFLEAARAGQDGPNGLMHLEQSLAAVADTGLGETEQLEVIRLVDEYVFGFNFGYVDPRAESEEHAPEIEYFEALLETGHYPHVEALIGPSGVAAAMERIMSEVFDEDRFERGLETLLDGVDLYIKRRRRNRRTRRR